MAENETMSLTKRSILTYSCMFMYFVCLAGLLFSRRRCHDGLDLSKDGLVSVKTVESVLYVRPKIKEQARPAAKQSPAANTTYVFD